MCKIMIQTRQILGGLMRLFQHQLNHTEFLTKTAQPKPTFLEEHYLRVQSPYLLNGYWFLLMLFPGENLSRIFEDSHKDSSADL